MSEFGIHCPLWTFLQDLEEAWVLISDFRNILLGSTVFMVGFFKEDRLLRFLSAGYRLESSGEKKKCADILFVI